MNNAWEYAGGYIHLHRRMHNIGDGVSIYVLHDIVGGHTVVDIHRDVHGIFLGMYIDVVLYYKSFLLNSTDVPK